MAPRPSCLQSSFLLFLIASMLIIEVSISALKRVNIDAPKRHTRSHVYSSATSVVKPVCVFLRAHTDTRRNAHATTIGRLRKANPSALRNLVI
ncbi:hypothetical protein L1049_004432 [Liquidambar formosana]|uniref:Uncharacterized protein n=1 Tax=Liquidambar formosana TaxID=63359 RepID=A0AAP0WVN8_LIQFO